MRRVLATAFLILAVSSGAARAITAQEALGELARLRTSAVDHAKIVKTHGKKEQILQAREHYTSAKGGADGIIQEIETSARLCVQREPQLGDKSKWLGDMEKSLGELRRIALSTPLPPNNGKRGDISWDAVLSSEIFGTSVKQLLSDFLSIEFPEKAVCDEIKNSLPDKKWPDFADIKAEKK
jgi:hypothetical protein